MGNTNLLSCLNDNIIECGCDEAGRGCLAGPVVAAAVIFPSAYQNAWIKDSKQLSATKRNELRIIIQKDAIAWAVGFVSNEEIDQVNILNASIMAMHRAIAQLTLIPQHIIVDGNRFKTYQEISHTCIIKGDTKYLSIAAASILAKTYRDEYMKSIHEQYPAYGWEKNKGYPTKEHRASILNFGISKFHRKTFQLLDRQLKFQF